MHSWVFRHRERLRVVFGLPAPALPAKTPAAGTPRVNTKYAPGTLYRTTRYTVISPMPRVTDRDWAQD